MGSQDTSPALESCWELLLRVFESYQSGISQVRKQLGIRRSSALGQLCAVNTKVWNPSALCLHMPPESPEGTRCEVSAGGHPGCVGASSPPSVHCRSGWPSWRSPKRSYRCHMGKCQAFMDPTPLLWAETPFSRPG